MSSRYGHATLATGTLAGWQAVCGDCQWTGNVHPVDRTLPHRDVRAAIAAAVSDGVRHRLATCRTTRAMLARAWTAVTGAAE